MQALFPERGRATLEPRSPKQLRESHIILGHAPREFSPMSSTIGGAFSPNRTLPPPRAYVKSQPKVRELLNHGTLKIGHNALGNNYTTTYQAEAKERSLEEAIGKRMPGNYALDSHFSLNESFPSVYGTETQDSFIERGKGNQVDKNSYVGHLKTHHFDLGPTK